MHYFAILDGTGERFDTVKKATHAYAIAAGIGGQVVAFNAADLDAAVATTITLMHGNTVCIGKLGD